MSTKITYRKGNLLDSEDFFIGHGCNCQGAMGAGVALAIKKRWNSAFEDYVDELRFGREPGTIIYSGPKNNQDKAILNMLTQFYLGRNAKYEYIQKCFASLSEDSNLINAEMIGQMNEDWTFKNPNNQKWGLSIPLIGCGIGGLKWNSVSAIIESYEYSFPITVWSLE